MYFKKECLIAIKILIIMLLVPIAYENNNFYRRAKLYISRRIYKLLLNETERKKRDDIKYFKIYNKLVDMPKDPNDPLIEKERKTILKQYYSTIKKKLIYLYYWIYSYFLEINYLL